MTPLQLPKFAKIKKRRILVISAGGIQAGIQGVYITITANTWEILSHAFVPYPQRVSDILERLSNENSPATISDLGWLDFKVTHLYIECANAAIVQLPKPLRAAHCIVLNRLQIWKSATGENLQQSHWNISCGDPQFLASSLGAPVITDFIRHQILAGGHGSIPTFPGNLIIARRYSGTVVFINIGVVSRLTIVDCESSSIVLDSDAGPGICLINKVAREIDCPDGFDREGSQAALGRVNSECLDNLVSGPWSLKSAPKSALPWEFDELLKEESLTGLAPLDRLATITALTARMIYDFYKREYVRPEPVQVVLLSGGGANNQTLIEFLKTYFDPSSIRNVEELGIPLDMRIPLALGLTVDAFLTGEKVPWETGNHPAMAPMGRWVLP